MLPLTLIVVGGVVLLLVRPAIVVGTTDPVPMLATLVVLIAVVSIAVPVPEEAASAPLRSAATLAIGLGAVMLVRAVAGSPPPLPIAAATPVLSALAAVAEEALFRRVLYDRLSRFGTILAIVGSAVAFTLLHVPLYGIAALPVDLGAGLLLSWQRWASGTWTVPAATHVAAQLLMGV
jgi:membrane protease YdiL (CAAX protease family)